MVPTPPRAHLHVAELRSRHIVRTTEGFNMSDKDSGPEAGVKGVVEDVTGKAKEAVGTVLGNKDLKHEGQAKQDKADAERDVAKKEAEAESARGAASAAENRADTHRRA
jgi:uncharacterized protein YjbJ (UPF0337 family)